MSGLSLADQLFLNVGRALTAWNRAEHEVLNLIEYGTFRGAIVNAELGAGYWAVVSFEARLKWCNQVVRMGTRFPGYENLSERWSALNNKLIAKARKRAEIAHGSVVTVRGSGQLDRLTLFSPNFHRKWFESSLLPMGEYHQTKLEQKLGALSVTDLEARTASFHRLRQTLWEFRLDWKALDVEKGHRAEEE